MQLDADTTWRFCALIASAGMIISSMEQMYSRLDFTERGMFAWSILRTDRMSSSSARSIGALTEILSRDSVFLAQACLRLLAALSIILLPDVAWIELTATAAIVASLVYFHYRVPLGLDGSDQMYLVVFAGLMACRLVPAGSPAAEWGLWFIGFQSSLAYVTAGVAKLISPTWRSGAAVILVFDTRTYGRPFFAGLMLDFPRLAFAVAWFVILFEALFPLGVLIGGATLMVFVLSALAFHVMTGVVMGLNSFVFAFPAALPAVLYTSERLRSFITTF